MSANPITMKLVVVLALLCCLAIGALATPLPKTAAKTTKHAVAVQESRQAAPAAAASDDDDDDDDDDVDLDITGDDDDDDDEEEEEDDDDDDDYLERFIDEVLGGEIL